MAILQEATFVGVNANDVRPGSPFRQEFAEAMARGQSHAYEALTGVKAPNSSTIAATPHVHDGTDGALMRVPIAQGVIHANLRFVPADVSGPVGADWAPFVLCPMFVPPGVSEVSVVVIGRGAQTIPRTVRASFLDTSLTEVAAPVTFSPLVQSHYFSGNGDEVYEARVSCNAGFCNILKLEAWDGKSAPDVDDDDTGPFLETMPRLVDTWHVLPVDRAPVAPIRWQDPETGDGRTTNTDSTFTTFDANEILDYDGLDGYTLREMNKDDGLLHEITTGRPRGLLQEASRLYTGHNHANDGATDLDDSGALADMPLGAWAFGVVRRVNTADVTRLSFDEASSAPVWSGKIIAPINKATTSEVTAAEMPFRMPTLERSVVQATSKINFAALIYKNDTTSATTRISIGDEDGSYDTATAPVTTASGVILHTGVVVADIDGAATSTQPWLRALAKLTLQLGTSKAQVYSVYGMCVWLEA